MMTNLFSSFDPSALFNISFNWLSALMITMFLTPLYWVIPAKTSMTAISLKNKLHLEFNALLGNKHLTGETILLLALFIFVLTNNFLGLFPYIFTASSHMTLTLSLAMPLWLTFMLFGWINHTNHMFAHMVPNGTPGILMPFMVLIESVSNLIRPITLSVRLMANMTAGHLLMTLLGNQTAVASNAILMSLLLIQTMLLTLESAVAVIQSYVFATLSTLYASEVMTH